MQPTPLFIKDFVKGSLKIFKVFLIQVHYLGKKRIFDFLLLFYATDQRNKNQVYQNFGHKKMVVGRQETELRESEGMISIKNRYFRRLTEERTTTATTTTTATANNLNNREVITMKQNNVVQQGGYGKMKLSSSSSYFGLESLVLLICLSASLLILPLILPPLPPPPIMLLSLPICILAGLLILAFSSSNGRTLTTKYRYM